MKNSQAKSYQCLKHTGQKIMFICAINDWHFEPLCQLCTPDHTQNHAKRLKINFESFSSINNLALERQPSVISTYETQIKRIQKVLSYHKIQELAFIKDLKQIQQQIINRIRQYFMDLNIKVSYKLSNKLDQNAQKIIFLKKNLESQILSIKQIKSNQISLNDWKNSVRKIYFQEKIDAYIEETKQIIQDFQLKYIEINKTNIKNLFTDQSKLLNPLISFINTQIKVLIGQNFTEQQSKIKTGANIGSKNLKKLSEKDSIQMPILKQKSKICKNCNQEMEYLTQNKKHLICRFCNTKERNYTKKNS